MKINTSRFGEVEVDENLIFNFIEPILGYEHLSKFVLLDNESNSPFKWFQSVQDPKIAFPVTFPAFFGIEYQFVIPEEKAKKLNLTSSDNLLSFNISCIPQGDPHNATVNLVGPIVINMENKNGMQLVLTDTNVSTKHRLFVKQPLKPEKAEV